MSEPDAFVVTLLACRLDLHKPGISERHERSTLKQGLDPFQGSPAGGRAFVAQDNRARTLAAIRKGNHVRARFRAKETRTALKHNHLPK